MNSTIFSSFGIESLHSGVAVPIQNQKIQRKLVPSAGQLFRVWILWTYAPTFTCGHKLWAVTEWTILQMQSAEMSSQLRCFMHLVRVPPGCFHRQVFQICPTRRGPRCKPRTRGKDYTSQLVWECHHFPLWGSGTERSGSFCLGCCIYDLNMGEWMVGENLSWMDLFQCLFTMLE